MTHTTKVLLLAFAALLGVGAYMSVARMGSANVISLDGVVKLPASPSSAAWSPDGRKLLVNLPYILAPAPGNEASVLIDTESLTVGEPMPTIGSGLDHYFWSPNGKYIAIVRARKIRLVRFPESETVAEFENEPDAADHICTFQSEYGAQFTSDSKFLWVACNISKAVKDRASYPLAVKVSIPEMKVVDRLDAPHPAPGKWLSGHHHVARHGGGIILTSTLRINTDKPYEPDEYLSAYELQNKAELCPAFKISDAGVDGMVGRAQAYSKTHQLMFVRAKKSTWNKEKTKLSLNAYTLSAVDCSTRKAIATHALLEELSVGLGYMFLSPNEELLIALALSHDSNLEPTGQYTITVWRTKNLKFLQQIETGHPNWLGLSPGGDRLAVLANRELYIYSVAQNAAATEN